MATADLTLADQLAEWIADLDVVDLPREVRDRCADTVLDTVGLSIAALETDYGRAVRSAFADPGTATVFGLNQTVAPEAAAAINGTCGHGEDYDNTFEGCPVHSGVVIVPALLAAADRYGLSAAQTAKGIAIGIELMCRLGLVAKTGVHKGGFHPTAVIGTMAAAAGVGAALGLDRRQTRDSLGVAGSMASGIIEYLADGSSTKRLHAGWAAQSGLRAAALGAAGFTGPASVFEGTHGFFYAFTAAGFRADFGPLTERLGERWIAADVAFKPFACGTMTQPYVDCAIRLRREGIAPDQIKAIVCEVGEGTVHRLWEPLSGKRRPATPYAAKFSGPYCVAAGFVFEDAGLAEFTEAAVGNPDVLNLASKVDFIVDPDNPYPANYTGHVRATLVDGREVEARAPCLRGGVGARLSRSELLSKCAANLRFAGRNPARADTLDAFADRLMEGAGSVDTSILRLADA